MDKDGLSPSPALVDDVVAAVDIPVRPMLRLRDGFATDADEIEQLKQLACNTPTRARQVWSWDSSLRIHRSTLQS